MSKETASCAVNALAFCDQVDNIVGIATAKKAMVDDDDRTALLVGHLGILEHTFTRLKTCIDNPTASTARVRNAIQAHDWLEVKAAIETFLADVTEDLMKSAG